MAALRRPGSTPIDSTLTIDHEGMLQSIGQVAPPGPYDYDDEIPDYFVRERIPDCPPGWVSPKENDRVLHLIDCTLLPLMLGVYFLQSLDKATLAYASVFGIIEDIGLEGSQYSWLGSIVYIAQLIAQFPLAWLLVKLPIGKFTSCMVLLWGSTLTLMASAHTYRSLLFLRFWLGAFEASIAPSFVAITQMFWRRQEQPLRMSYWYAMNGFTGIFGSLMTWGLAKLSTGLKPYQTIFLFFGIATVLFSILLFKRMPDSPDEAKFLDKHEKWVAAERVRNGHNSTISRQWRWDHFWECVRDFKTWLWFALVLCISVPSGGVGSFGPLLVQSFGFDSFQAILFNIPFGAITLGSIIGGAKLATKYRKKGPVIAGLVLGPILGSMIMLATPRTVEYRSTLLFGYYLISIYPGSIPLMYSWSSSNTGGDTKGKCTQAVLFVGQSLGNIIGPQLYRPSDAPEYFYGLRANLMLYAAVVVLVVMTSIQLTSLNEDHLRRRREEGIEIENSTFPMGVPYEDDGNIGLKRHGRYDETDLQNPEFRFVL